MQKIIIFLLVFIQSYNIQALPAKNSYQVDVIIFAHTDNKLKNQEQSIKPALKGAQLLSNQEKNHFYRLLPNSASHLISEYYSLRKKPQYQILAHYSWIQPLKGKKTLLLKPPMINGWQMEGMFTLNHTQHYFLDTQLLIATEDNQQRFVFEKKERLNANNLYYLDNPGAGMFIRIQTEV